MHGARGCSPCFAVFRSAEIVVDDDLASHNVSLRACGAGSGQLVRHLHDGDERILKLASVTRLPSQCCILGEEAPNALRRVPAERRVGIEGPSDADALGRYTRSSIVHPCAARASRRAISLRMGDACDGTTAMVEVATVTSASEALAGLPADPCGDGRHTMPVTLYSSWRTLRFCALSHVSPMAPASTGSSLPTWARPSINTGVAVGPGILNAAIFVCPSSCSANAHVSGSRG